ncbi:MAG: vitamin K epoxide reductase family protein [bacterium]|nr:vitamin K epoxide reductase family protein [bacterium]
MPVDRWVAPFTTALALAGTAVSGYLTIDHYAESDLLVCSEGGTVNCGAVTTSAQSVLLGVPVALLGLLWFVGMAGLCLPVAWRASSRLVHQARLLGALAGIGFVLWLIYAELIIVGAICLWCTVAHVIAFGLFAVVVMTARELQDVG